MRLFPLQIFLFCHLLLLPENTDLGSHETHRTVAASLTDAEFLRNFKREENFEGKGRKHACPRTFNRHGMARLILGVAIVMCLRSYNGQQFET